MRLPKPERLALLTPEQRAVYDNWLKEDTKFTGMLDRMLAAMEQQDTLLVQQINDEMDGAFPTHCEHERSVFSPCSACNEIEHILYPEFYDENGDQLSDEEIDAIIAEEMKHEAN